MPLKTAKRFLCGRISLRESSRLSDLARFTDYIYRDDCAGVRASREVGGLGESYTDPGRVCWNLRNVPWPRPTVAIGAATAESERDLPHRGSAALKNR